MSGLKDAALGLAGISGTFAVARRLSAGRARILAYHGVDESRPGIVNRDGFQVEPSVFRAQLEHVARHFQPMSLVEVISGIRGESSLPPRAVAITFDDGYKNNRTQAAVVLHSMGLPATFFVTTGFIDGAFQPWWYVLRSAIDASKVTRFTDADGRQHSLGTTDERWNTARNLESRLKLLSSAERAKSMDMVLRSLGVVECPAAYDFMSWEDCRALAAQGFEVAPHTVSHISFGHETPDVQRTEIEMSCRRFRDVLGFAPRTFSYPYGRDEHLSARLSDLVREAGCLGAVTTNSGLNPIGADPYRLRRLNVTGNHRESRWEALVSGLTARRS